MNALNETMERYITESDANFTDGRANNAWDDDFVLHGPSKKDWPMPPRFLASTASVLLVAGCADRTAPLSRHVGEQCTVQLRRGDALGAAGEAPVAPTTTNLNGADVNLVGVLKQVREGWVVIESRGRLFHLPTSSILLIEFAVKEKK
ncbi:MAG: hypothetical protein ACRDD1_00035 [Planctomycetia bacterium]